MPRTVTGYAETPCASTSLPIPTAKRIRNSSSRCGTAFWEEEGALLGDAGSRDDAILLANSQLNEIEAIAKECLEENGCHMPVEARITQQWFNTRTYGELTLPAGQYEALQVRIGEPRGKNWWCVLFPPFCLPAARSKADAEQAFQEAAKVVESNPQYEMRFALLEWLEKLIKSFQ